MMGGALGVDFEGDQWTFFKPRPEDLVRLYGLDIHEMQPYRPLPEQIAEQIELGRTIAVELDSWYLPDTAATSYRSEHVKSSVDRRGDRPRGGGRCATSTGPATSSSTARTTAASSGSAATSPTTSCRPTRSWSASTPASPWRREELRAAARELLAETLERAPRGAPSSASAPSSSATCRACSTATSPPTTTTPSRPCAWSARPSRPAAPTSSGCSATTGRRRWRRSAGSSRAARRSPSSWRAAASSTRRGDRRARRRLGGGLRGAGRCSCVSARRRRPRARRVPRRAADRRRLGGRALRAGRPSRPVGPRRPRVARRHGAGDRCRGAARRRSLAAPESRSTSTPRTGGSASPIRGRARPLRARRSSCASGDRHRRRGLPQRRAAASSSESMFHAARGRGRRPAAGRRQRAGDPLPRARAAARGAAQAACPLAARSSSPTGLRFQRTMLLGRMPGLAPGPQAVGPWRGVSLAAPPPARRRAPRDRGAPRGRRRRARGPRPAAPARRRGPRLGRGRALGPLGRAPRRARARRRAGRRRGERLAAGAGCRPLVAPHARRADAARRLAAASRWARPMLGSIAAGSASASWPRGRAPAHDVEADGLDLHVNGVPRLRPRRRLDAGRPGRPGAGRGRAAPNASSASATPA